MSISATVVQSIANAYFKVIDKYNSSSDIITSATDLPGTGENTTTMLTELTDYLKTFTGAKYWMILNQGDVYYVIFLNSTVDDGVETKDSWIVGTYSTKSPGWVGTHKNYTYEIEKDDDENVTGLKLTPGIGSPIEFNLTNDGDTPIATLNGTVDTQFAWTAAKRTAILTSSGIAINDSDTNAVFYSPTNMKVDGDDFKFKGKYKHDTLDDSYYEEIGNFRDTNGFIILDGINIGNGEKDNNKQFTTWFSRSLHKINGTEYVHFKFGDGTVIHQEIDIPKSDEHEPDSITYNVDGSVQKIAYYVINLPAYSGLEGNFAITVLFCKLDLNQFNVNVDNYTDNGNVVHDKIQDPRSYLFRDPNSSSFGEISNQYVDQVTVDIVKVIPEYRKFYNRDSFTVGEGPVFYALSNDISNKKIPYGLVTLRVDQKIVKDNTDKYGSMYFIWNRSSDGIPDKRIVYSDNSPIQYDENKGNYTPGEVTISDNTFKCKMPVQDLGIFNYQSTTSTLVDNSTENIRGFPLGYEIVNENPTGYQTFETLIPLLNLYSIGTKVLMSDCYTASIEVTNAAYNEMNLVKYASDFASTTDAPDDKLKGLEFKDVGGLIVGRSKYTIVFQLELTNIDASGEDTSYYGNEGGSKDERYVLIYINKAESDTNVGFVEKWRVNGLSEISPIDCGIVIGTDSITLTNSIGDVATINADSLIVPRKSSFEDGIPINALAKFKSGVETNDDYKNYYTCKIVAFYGPEAAGGGGGQGDDGFINLFFGKMDIRLYGDDTKTLTENYSYFNSFVNGYIDSKNYSPFTNMTDFIEAISGTTTIVRSYFLSVFIKYRYVYDVTRSAGAKPVNGNVYHYYTGFMEYEPKLTNNANPTAANGKYNYSSGTVKNIFGLDDVFSFEVTNSGSDSFISVYTDAEYGDKIIDFGDVKVNTLDDMTIDNIDIVPKNGDSNDIADYMINNGINMANVRTFNGTDMSFIPKDFDNEPGRTLKSVSIDRMIIRCIPVKSKV